MTTATRSYDFIGFGDEVPGILSLVSAAREYYSRTGSYPKSVLMLRGNAQDGVGGHLVRGRLAYLDRSRVPEPTRRDFYLENFGDPPAIYREFLQRSGVDKVAIDPGNANLVLREMMSEVGIDILSNAKIASVLKAGGKITGLQLARGETFLGKQFIDSTVNGELAQLAGIKKLTGYASLGLPQSELSVTLVFATEGLSPQELSSLEFNYLKRFTNASDTEAQKWIEIAAGGDASLAQLLRNSLTRAYGQLNTLDLGTDYIDVYSRALSIAYHAFRGTKHYLPESKAILDNPNIAVFPDDRLFWNGVLFFVNASQAEALARGGAKPTAEMLKEMGYVERWLKSLGATSVRIAPELYIRHAGNIVGAVDLLSGAQMTAGGVPESQALGTFGYQFDTRGGIHGLWQRAANKGVKKFAFKAPLLNVGMRHALLKDISNLAVISPASGFTGGASAVGRIVEFNVAVGQSVGIAMAIALLSNRNLSDIPNEEVHNTLVETDRLPKIYGRYDPTDTSTMGDFEKRMYEASLAIPVDFNGAIV